MWDNKVRWTPNIIIVIGDEINVKDWCQDDEINTKLLWDKYIGLCKTIHEMNTKPLLSMMRSIWKHMWHRMVAIISDNAKKEVSIGTSVTVPAIDYFSFVLSVFWDEIYIEDIFFLQIFTLT